MSWQMKCNISISFILVFVVFPLMDEETEASKKKNRPWERLGELLREYTTALLYWTGLRDPMLFTVEELEEQVKAILETITGYNNRIQVYQNDIARYTELLIKIATDIGTLSSVIRTLDGEISSLDAQISEINK